MAGKKGYVAKRGTQRAAGGGTYKVKRNSGGSSPGGGTYKDKRASVAYSPGGGGYMRGRLDKSPGKQPRGSMAAGPNDPYLPGPPTHSS